MQDKQSILAIKALFDSAQKFQSTVPRIQQKHLSTFYTQPGAALLLAGLTIRNPKERVLDPACGSGMLLLAAFAQKKNLLHIMPKLPPSIIQANQIVGCEIDPFAANFTLQSLESLKNPHDDTNILLLQENAFTAALPLVDVVLMNPPFTRQERITTQDQAIIQKKFMELNLAQYFESQMSLGALFILLADHYLRLGGRMGLVIPAATFSSRYTAEVVRFLQDRQYAVRFLIEVLGENSAFSEDCRYKEYLIVLEKGSAYAEKVPIITLSTPPTIDTFEQIARVIVDGTSDLANTGVQKGYLPQKQLFTLQNWEMAFKQVTNPHIFNLLDSLPLIPFEQQSCIKIRSGFHGTYVDFLFLPNNHWNIVKDNFPNDVLIAPVESSRKDPLQVPPHLLRRAFRKPENTQSLYASASHFVLSIPPDESLPREFLVQYIQDAEGKLRESMAGKVQRGGKETGDVPPRWYSHAFCNGAEKSIGYLWTFEKIYPLNRANLTTFSRELVTAPNMFHLIYGDDLLLLEALHSWFNTTFFFCEYLLHVKSIRRGWLKGTIGLFKTLRVPNFSSSFFTPEKIVHAQHAIRVFFKAIDSQLLPIASQIGTPSRKELDLAWAEILEVPLPKREQLIFDAGEFVRHFVEQR